MADVVYVRNTRPNAVLLRVGRNTDAVAQPLERRGSRADTTAIPADWLEDPVISQFIQRGIIEVISREDFMSLGTRGEGVPAFRLKEKGKEVNVPILDPEVSRTPYLITDKDLEANKDLRSPSPEFDERVPSTAEEISTGVVQPRQAPSRVKLPVSNEEKLQGEVNDLKTTVAAQSEQLSQVLALLQKQAESQNNQAESEPAAPKPRARKSTGTKTKSTTRNKKS